ncbi:MAG: reverse transcriptase family protein, partial [Lachnospiraceae bacterium]|nr:reverse transcriptase family protein [Lachnospiraceae bacterium]
MEKDTDKIKHEFFSLITRQDVADLLGITERSLRYFLYAVRPDNMYTQFVIKKKNGDDRYINAPDEKLRNIQRKLANILNCVYKVKPAAHGFAVDKNIITNAKNHVRRKYVFNMDLENFFDQIHFGRVRGMLMNPPYSIGSEAALVIAQIACYKGKLPQGAPSSPILTNMICAPLDTQFTRLAREYNLCYSRYADDITFSSNKNVFPQEIVYTDLKGVHLGKEIQDILTKNSFSANQRKTRIFDSHRRQEVTGLVVNRIVNIRRSYVKKIRAILFHCKNDGIYQTAKVYIEKGNCNNSKIIEMLKNETEENQEIIVEWFKAVLKGKIGYIKQVRGKKNLIFLKYEKIL